MWFNFCLNKGVQSRKKILSRTFGPYVIVIPSPIFGSVITPYKK